MNADTRPASLPQAPEEPRRADPALLDALRLVGETVAEPLTEALEWLAQLDADEPANRETLRLVRDRVQHARQAGIVAQQLARYETADLRLSQERLHLPQILQDVLASRARECQLRGKPVRPVVSPVEVVADPTLLFALCNAAIDWALVHAQAGIEIRVDQKLWPSLARVQVSFAPAPESTPLADLNWRLVERIGARMQVHTTQEIEPTMTRLVLEFEPLAADAVVGLSVVELDPHFNPSASSRPIAGSQVLAIVSRRGLRADVRDALRAVDLVLDFASSLDDAQEFCQRSLPHGIVVESALRGERFDALRADLLARRPDMAFVEIIEEGRRFEISGFSGSSIAKVGRDSLVPSLALALSHELGYAL